MAQKRLIFTSKWTTVWHHGMVHALLNTHLRSFESLIPMEEQRPHCKRPLDTTKIVLSFQDDRPENSHKTAIFGH